MSESAAKPNTKLANRGSLVTRFRIGPVLALMLAILTVLLAYLATLTAGHAFIGDDFAAYVMHAVNLAEGHAYHDIRYVTNPAAIGFSRRRVHPPVYPLLLAPVYKIWGLNLHAMKVVTVACFGVSLGVLALLFRARLPQWALSALIGLIGFNIVFWSQHDYLLSESAFLMFSFGALLAAQKIYADLKPKEWRFGAAFLLSVLFYAAYGTRTVGFVLLPALILADVCKFRRPSRFLVMVVTLTAGLILLQNTLLLSPRAYMNAEHISVSMIREHVAFMARPCRMCGAMAAAKPCRL